MTNSTHYVPLFTLKLKAGDRHVGTNILSLEFQEIQRPLLKHEHGTQTHMQAKHPWTLIFFKNRKGLPKLFQARARLSQKRSQGVGESVTLQAKLNLLSVLLYQEVLEPTPVNWPLTSPRVPTHTKQNYKREINASKCTKK